MMSTFSLTASVLLALVCLAFTLVGVSNQDAVAIYMGELMGGLTILFFACGLISLMRGN